MSNRRNCGRRSKRWRCAGRRRGSVGDGLGPARSRESRLWLKQEQCPVVAAAASEVPRSNWEPTASMPAELQQCMTRLQESIDEPGAVSHGSQSAGRGHGISCRFRVGKPRAPRHDRGPGADTRARSLRQRSSQFGFPRLPHHERTRGLSGVMGHPGTCSRGGSGFGSRAQRAINHHSAGHRYHFAGRRSSAPVAESHRDRPGGATGYPPGAQMRTCSRASARSVPGRRKAAAAVELPALAAAVDDSATASLGQRRLPRLRTARHKRCRSKSTR